MAREAEMFGEALKRWRGKRGLTQEALAHDAGITASYYGQLERGMKSPTLTVILKLCRALEHTPAELLADFTSGALKRLRFRVQRGADCGERVVLPSAPRSLLCGSRTGARQRAPASADR